MKELKKLRQKWYEVLRKDGFQDIEFIFDDGTVSSKLQTWRIDNKRHPIIYMEVQEFYRLATHFLNDYNFRNETERRIWELFSDGINYRAISKDTKMTFYSVQKFIKQIITGPFAEYRKMIVHDAI